MLVDKLDRRKRRKGEPLHKVRDDIVELVGYAYPDADQATQQSLGVEKFIRSLDNPKVIHHLLELNPKTVKEAYEAACLEESTWHTACSISQGVPTRSVTVEDGDDWRGEIRQLTTAMSSLQAAVTEKSSPNDRLDNAEERDGACWHCKEMGHWASKCPKKRRGGHSGRGRGGGGRSGGRGRHGHSGRGRSQPVCYRCQEEGHQAKDCLAPAPVPKEALK